MRVLFMGTGEIGLPSLEWLLGTVKHEVVGVVTQPDKRVGRRQVMTAPGPKVRALEAGVRVFQPGRIREAVGELAGLGAEVAVVIAYGQILNRAVLEMPRLGCVNVHASILPRHRGASPIQAAIDCGDAETGVTLMYMDEGLDTGDELLTLRTGILPGETGGELHDRLAALAPVGVEQALDWLAAGVAPRRRQREAEATYAGKLLREDGRLDWGRSAVEVERRVRAYQPWPGTFAELPGGEVLKIYAVKVRAGVGEPGRVVSADGVGGLCVGCGVGVVELVEVQAPGGRRMGAADFLRGRGLEVGTILR